MNNKLFMVSKKNKLTYDGHNLAGDIDSKSSSFIETDDEVAN